MSEAPKIFDHELLRVRRARLARRLARQGAAANPPDFLLRYATQDVVDRLQMIKRDFSEVLVVGGHNGVMPQALKSIGVPKITVTEAVPDLLGLDGALPEGVNVVASDGEDLAFAPETFDLAVAVLSLQYINDLPGVLAQIERVLRPDGLFIGVVLGGATLGELRQVMLAAEAELTGGASPRVMPFIDVRDAGALLQRAGFALPVSDSDTLAVSYGSALELMRELKAMGAGNVLQERARVPMTRGVILRAAEIYGERYPADDGEGRIKATFELVTLTGWSPHSSQQKPLKPGSAAVSLADVLKPGNA